MAIDLSNPHPPHLRDPPLFIAEMLLAFVLLLGVTAIVDKLGTAMFHRGFAKPFYIRGRRIHHSVIYMIVPMGYGTVSVLYFLGYFQFNWSQLWIGLAYVTAITAICMAVDAIGDKYWPEIRKNVILHHEWIYSLIPAYIFLYAPMFIVRI